MTRRGTNQIPSAKKQPRNEKRANIKCPWKHFTFPSIGGPPNDTKSGDTEDTAHNSRNDSQIKDYRVINMISSIQIAINKHWNLRTAGTRRDHIFWIINKTYIVSLRRMLVLWPAPSLFGFPQISVLKLLIFPIRAIHIWGDRGRARTLSMVTGCAVNAFKIDIRNDADFSPYDFRWKVRWSHGIIVGIASILPELRWCWFNCS